MLAAVQIVRASERSMLMEGRGYINGSRDAHLVWFWKRDVLGSCSCGFLGGQLVFAGMGVRLLCVGVRDLWYFWWGCGFGVVVLGSCWCSFLVICVCLLWGGGWLCERDGLRWVTIGFWFRVRVFLCIEWWVVGCGWLRWMDLDFVWVGDFFWWGFA